MSAELYAIGLGSQDCSECDNYKASYDLRISGQSFILCGDCLPEQLDSYYSQLPVSPPVKMNNMAVQFVQIDDCDQRFPDVHSGRDKSGTGRELYATTTCWACPLCPDGEDNHLVSGRPGTMDSDYMDVITDHIIGEHVVTKAVENSKQVKEM